MKTGTRLLCLLTQLIALFAPYLKAYLINFLLVLWLVQKQFILMNASLAG